MAVRGSGLSLRKRDPGRQRRVRVPCPFQDTRNARANASGTRSKGKAARAEVSGNKGELKAGWEPAPGTRPGCHRTVTGPSPGGAGCCHIALAEEGQTQFGGKGFSGSSILRDGAGFHTLPVPTASGMELEPLIPPVLSSLGTQPELRVLPVPSSLRDGASPPHPACLHFPADGWMGMGSCIPPVPRFLRDGDGAPHPVPSSVFPALSVPGRCSELREVFSSSPEFNPNPGPCGLPTLELTPNQLCRIPA